MNLMFIKGVIYQVVKLITLIPIYFKIKRNPDKYTLEEKFAIINKYTEKTLKFCKIKITVSGYENLPNKNENVMFVANHANWVDAFILLAIVDRPVSMITAKEANWDKVPFIRGWMNMINCLHIDRNNTRNALRTINEASDILKNTSSIGVFPEGVVTLSDDITPFKDGVFRMAIKSQVSIVPIHIINSKDILKITSRWTGKAYSKNVRVEILPMINTHLNNSTVKTKELSNIVRTTLIEHKKEIENLS